MFRSKSIRYEVHIDIAGIHETENHGVPLREGTYHQIQHNLEAIAVAPPSPQTSRVRHEELETLTKIARFGMLEPQRLIFQVDEFEQRLGKRTLIAIHDPRPLQLGLPLPQEGSGDRSCPESNKARVEAVNTRRAIPHHNGRLRTSTGSPKQGVQEASGHQAVWAHNDVIVDKHNHLVCFERLRDCKDLGPSNRRACTDCERTGPTGPHRRPSDMPEEVLSARSTVSEVGESPRDVGEVTLDDRPGSRSPRHLGKRRIDDGVPVDIVDADGHPALPVDP
mmetsp:Transcript_150884/g.483126  ORF Transcript_150884/g.483126 Transcript_150884/m.483126 type:complete len:279 (-) Transcript_150884:602-1438(-)